MPTYRELILDLENATKRQANLEGWSSAKRDRMLGALDRIRETLGDYLDRQAPRIADA